MIPPLLLPFNLTKATLNSALVMVLCKPISTAPYVCRHAAGQGGCSLWQIAPGSTAKSLAMLLAGVLLAIVLCVVFLIHIMGGNFSLFKGILRRMVLGRGLCLMIKAISEFFLEKAGAGCAVLLCSMLPIIERGAIPLGAGLGATLYRTTCLPCSGTCCRCPLSCCSSGK